MILEEIRDQDALLASVGRGQLKDWLQVRESPLWRTLPGMTRDAWVRFHTAEIERLTSTTATMVFHAPELPGLIVGRHLDWDTDILGVDLGCLEYLLYPAADGEGAAAMLRAACDHWRKLGWRLLVHKTSASDISALSVLSRSDFDLLTVHLEYLFETRNMTAYPSGLDGYTFGPASAEEAPLLGQLSHDNHARLDRFRADPLIPQTRVGELYRQWAHNSVQGFADLVWVARRHDQPVGFGSWRLRRSLAEHTGVRCAEYQLGAVAKSERNRGIFRRVTSGALVHLAGLDQVWGSGATNALNIPTQRCFQSLDAWIHGPILTYRKDLARA